MTLAYATGVLFVAAGPTAICGLIAIALTLHAEWRGR